MPEHPPSGDPPPAPSPDRGRGSPGGAGRLVVIATPIGNLDDIAPRAVEALAGADLVLAEDTRRTGRLLAHLGIDADQRSHHEHNAARRTAEVLDELRTGAVVALVTDAGMPAISDPGERLVAACAEAAVPVTVIPGPSAVTAALAVSGLPTGRFVMEGFLPRKASTREERLGMLAAEPRTIVLFASPHRVVDDLTDLAEHLGPDRPAVLCRELTKLHEEVWRGTLAQLRDRTREGVRGEITLVVGGRPDRPPPDPGDEELVARVRELVATGLRRKAAIKAVARGAQLPKRRVYQAVVDASG